MKLLNKLAFYSLLELFTLFVFSQQSVIAHTFDNEEINFFKSNEGTSNLLANIDDLRILLLSDSESIIIKLPLPDGELVKFKLMPEKIMANELAKKYPSIRTFSGVALNNPNNTGRFDITPNGFHGMFFYGGERVFIEPDNVYMQDQATLIASKETALTVKRDFNYPKHEYKSYFRQDSRLPSQLTHNFKPAKKMPEQLFALTGSKRLSSNKTTNTIALPSTMTTYRLAISAAAEYTAFHGGTVDSAMAEIITLVNRLNQIYQHDLAIKLELVENSDLLIFTNSTSDPFNNDSDDGDLNTAAIDSIIGSDNYDIGHVVNTDGGGLAVLGGVCHSSYKGDGVTGDPVPTNDAFYVDYVAHEIGHQFGADHTFNGTAGACEGNRVSDSAYEVGSGSTIMAYAGICGDQNIQPHSDAFFHARSIDQIHDNILSGVGSTCGVISTESNNTAVVYAGSDYTIPAQTPFKLSGSAQDDDSVNLTYSWQQFDLGEASASFAEQVDDGTRPLFRAFLPSSNANRYFPQLSDVLNGKSTKGESLPTTNRELNFRLMVFDGEGGVSFDETKLTVVDTGKAFSLNSPLVDDIWTVASNNISWQVADTDLAPINCTTVDILLSKDNGETFDISLANNVLNNGNADIDINSFCANTINTTQARIKLACSNNIFYTVNNGPFSIDKALSPSDITITGQQFISFVQGGSVAINSSQFTYACTSADSISIQAGDNYTFSEGIITANADFVGELKVAVMANKETISSDVFVVTITVEAKPEPEPQPEPQSSSGSSSGSISWLLLCFGLVPLRKRCNGCFTVRKI